MSFDKVQAMRNAERHVSQGKIRAAIAEYKLVIDHDPKDVVTMNMLGDLFAKDSNKSAAIDCYKKVAEHYNKQGFSQKAIAVYKKIAKLDPNSVETSGKLAELYQTKGSVTEARSHFATLADHYQQQGRKVEALAIWKQISILDQNDTEVLLKAAHVYLEEEQFQEAADAYCELGLRLLRIGRSEPAAEMYSEAIAIIPTHLAALEGFVKAKTKLGLASEASQKLEAILEEDPYNQDVIAISIDCFIGADDIANAEKRTIRLVEQEPAMFPKLIELVEIFLSRDDLVGAARCLTLAMENLLLGGRGEEAGEWIDKILAADPEQLGALKLKVRFFSWQRDDKGLTGALRKLDEIAVKQSSLEDERYALSQLVMLLPQETDFADRLRKINDKHGFTDNLYDEVILKQTFEDQADLYADELATGFDFSGDDETSSLGEVEPEPLHVLGRSDLLERNGISAPKNTKSNGSHPKTLEPDLEIFAKEEAVADLVSVDPKASKDEAVSKDVESVQFYIDSGYADLAETALKELEGSNGAHPQVALLRGSLDKLTAAKVDTVIAAPNESSQRAIKDPLPAASAVSGSKTFDLDEIRTEFGLDEEGASVVDDGDYDTHYQMAVAYQEMGLMEDAIKEFQDAINQIGDNDKNRRFFQCSNLLGHCFMQKGMAKLALKWFNRALETPDLNSDEKKGIWYELGEAYQVDGDTDNAARYFEQVYAEDVDFRDVGSRIQNLTLNV